MQSLVLRYSPYSQEVINIIKSRQLGEIVNIQHLEPVSYAGAQTPTRHSHRCHIDRVLPLCTFLCSRKLGGGEGLFVLANDEELPVSLIEPVM